MIADKSHIHMNATKWDTLTTFVKYLGKSAQAVVDETEKVWIVVVDIVVVELVLFKISTIRIARICPAECLLIFYPSLPPSIHV